MLANSLGRSVLDGVVAISAYAGPPILVVGQALASTDDARWVAALDFAAGFSAPLIGLTVSGSAVTEDTAVLIRQLGILSFVHNARRLGQLLWSDSGASARTVSACGPILSIPSTASGATSCGQAAWDLSALLAAAPANHRYGTGMMGVGGGDPLGLCGPPVFPLLPSGLVSALSGLAKLWRGGAPVTKTAVQYLRDVESGTSPFTGRGRPGLARVMHPALVGYALPLRPPVPVPTPSAPASPPAEETNNPGTTLQYASTVTLPSGDDSVTLSFPDQGSTDFSVQVDNFLNVDDTVVSAVAVVATATSAVLYATSAAQADLVVRFRIFR